jgi:hypothetical protein
MVPRENNKCGRSEEKGSQYSQPLNIIIRKIGNTSTHSKDVK